MSARPRFPRRRGLPAPRPSRDAHGKHHQLAPHGRMEVALKGKLSRPGRHETDIEFSSRLNVNPFDPPPKGGAGGRFDLDIHLFEDFGCKAMPDLVEVTDGDRRRHIWLLD